jgi:hypothetical protein
MINATIDWARVPVFFRSWNHEVLRQLGYGVCSAPLQQFAQTNLERDYQRGLSNTHYDTYLNRAES